MCDAVFMQTVGVLFPFKNTPTHKPQVKTGPFAEHSNALWGISSVAEWTKVNSGLIKMYKAEVCVHWEC